MPRQTDWKTIKITSEAYDKAQGLRDLLTRRGTDSLPAGLRDVELDGIGIGSTITLALAALEQALGASTRRRRP